MKEKLSVVLGIGVLVCVVFTFGFYFFAKGAIELFDVISLSIISIILITSTYIIWDRFKNLKKGLPVQDERMKQLGYKAGYYGFIAAIWSAIGSNMTSIILFDEELRGGLVVASVVLVSGIVFMLSYLYLAWKGN